MARSGPRTAAGFPVGEKGPDRVSWPHGLDGNGRVVASDDVPTPLGAGHGSDSAFPAKGAVNPGLDSDGWVQAGDGSTDRGFPLDADREARLAPNAPGTVGAGNHFSTFLRDGVLYAAGENVVGQLGIGTTGFDIKAPVAVKVPADAGQVIAVESGMLHTTFLTEDGGVWAFGFNNNGALGLGDETTRPQPTRLAALDDAGIVEIENGNGVSFAIAATGRLFAWGSNGNGQLGTGDTTERLVPTEIPGLAGEIVTGVSSGTSHTLVVTADGAVYAFGSNIDAQVDPSGTRRVPDPVRVEGLPDTIVSVTADGNTSFATTADGRVFGWGQSDFGQLLQGIPRGDGTFDPDRADVIRPVELTALPDGVIAVKGGARWGIALTEDGTVWAWGPNDEGPTGGLDGAPETVSGASFLPTRVPGLEGVRIVAIETGPNSILLVADTGAIYGFGANGDGRLGFVQGGMITTPVRIEFDADTAPWLVSASPSDNARDVAGDAMLELTFTEAVRAGEGSITLVNRDNGARLDIDTADGRLVRIDGAAVTVASPEHFEPGARYAVEISRGAFLDTAGQAYSGIARGDVSALNFTVGVAPSASAPLKGTWHDDLLRGGFGDDRINGGWGDDVVSGGGGRDVLSGGWGNDWLLGGKGDDRLDGGFGHDRLDGGAGNDRVIGGWGNDALAGGAGDDTMTGGCGEDVFVFDGGRDRVADFQTGTRFLWFETPEDRLQIRVAGIDDADDAMAAARQAGRSVVFDFGEAGSLTLEATRLSHLSDDHFVFA